MAEMRGGGDLEEMIAIDILPGGYVLSGYTYSSDGDITDHHGSADFWVVRLNEDGSMVWQRTLGGTENENSYAICSTVDGGYILSGFTYSNNGDVSGNNGSGDAWIVKLAPDPTGVSGQGAGAHFSLFPNPTTGDLTIHFEATSSRSNSIGLYDGAGRLLMNLQGANTTTRNSLIKFSIADLPAGIYYLHGVFDARQSTHKVVKL